MIYHVDQFGNLLTASEVAAHRGDPLTHVEDREYASLKAFIEQSRREPLAVSVTFGTDGFSI